METGCNDLFGNYCKEGTFEQAQIAIFNDEMRQLYYDFEVLRNLLEALDDNTARYHTVFRSLSQAAYALNPLNSENMEKAKELLKKRIR